MTKRKIIHIAGPSAALETLSIDPDSNEYLTWAWSRPVAVNTIKYSDQYKVECWRSEPDIKKTTTRYIDDILYKLFPCRKIEGIGYISYSLLRALKEEVKNQQVLLHLHEIHNLESCMIAYLFNKYPIVAQNNGLSSPRILFKKRKRLIYLFGYYLLEKPTLKYIDHFFVISKKQVMFLSSFLDKSKIDLQNLGVNFDEFVPIDQIAARKRIGIPLNKKVMIYIGRFYKLKGVDIILKAFRELKNNFDLELILIGGTKDDEYYSEAIKLGARVYEFIPHHEIPLWLSAADVYLLPAFGLDAGIGVAVMEALSCGVPVVSTTLDDFPNYDLHKVGKMPKDELDVVKCIYEILNNKNDYTDCRDVARKYYDWGPIINNTCNIYENLFRIYYR